MPLLSTQHRLTLHFFFTFSYYLLCDYEFIVATRSLALAYNYFNCVLPLSHTHAHSHRERERDSRCHCIPTPTLESVTRSRNAYKVTDIVSCCARPAAADQASTCKHIHTYIHTSTHCVHALCIRCWICLCATSLD